MTEKNNAKIVTISNLQNFFFDTLIKLNKKKARPLPEEAIFYSSDVLNRYIHSSNYFENVDGKIQDKVLGIKVLEAGQKPLSEQESIYRDVAETTLVLCGCFSSSVGNKIVSASYYNSIGKMAFAKMNDFRPNFMDVPSFFKQIAGSFEEITNMLSLIEPMNNPTKILSGDNLSAGDASLLGINQIMQKKIS